MLKGSRNGSKGSMAQMVGRGARWLANEKPVESRAY